MRIFVCACYYFIWPNNNSNHWFSFLVKVLTPKMIFKRFFGVQENVAKIRKITIFAIMCLFLAFFTSLYLTYKQQKTDIHVRICNNCDNYTFLIPNLVDTSLLKPDSTKIVHIYWCICFIQYVWMIICHFLEKMPLPLQCY